MMLDDDQLSRLSPLARRFRVRLAEQLGDIPRREEFTDRYELVIPAAHSDVGALWVWDDGDELTIGLGEYHHWHVSLDHFEKEPESRRVAAAAEAAVTDIASILGNRTVLRITRRDGQVIRSMTYRPDLSNERPPSADEIEFVWTGPRSSAW